MLSGKRILLGISGSIAAYKAADLLRRLTEHGADVRVVMTRNAERFVGQTTFAALSGTPVLIDEFSGGEWGAMGHIAVTDALDLFVVAPATADIIGKAAAGIADDALTTALVAAECPIIMAPAMNDRMYRNAILQRNVGTLRDAGVRFVEPEEGSLACGVQGRGRLASIDRILAVVKALLSSPKPWAGKTILISAGPTREPIDAVRFISNPSSGKMGYALAAAARDRGADVLLVSGPTSITPPSGVRLIRVTTAAEMYHAVMDHADHAGIVIMAAAVSDFRPTSVSAGKIKKESAPLAIPLERTDDILLSLAQRNRRCIIVGFAAETDEVIAHAREKLVRKNLDLIVANDITQPGSGFGTDTNSVSLIQRGGTITEYVQLPKRELAERILDKIAELEENQGL